jgi:hypothetical protein
VLSEFVRHSRERAWKEAKSGWIGAVRPSRRPLSGLLRMRDFLYAIKGLPHPEERRKARLEGRTTAMHQFLHTLFRGVTIPSGGTEIE